METLFWYILILGLKWAEKETCQESAFDPFWSSCFSLISFSMHPEVNTFLIIRASLYHFPSWYAVLDPFKRGKDCRSKVVRRSSHHRLVVGRGDNASVAGPFIRNYSICKTACNKHHDKLQEMLLALYSGTSNWSSVNLRFVRRKSLKSWSSHVRQWISHIQQHQSRRKFCAGKTCEVQNLRNNIETIQTIYKTL